MSWTVLHIIGIMAYAISGALVAIEAKYSFTGVYVLGLTTSFGGATVRNLLIGAPVSELWDSGTITIVFVTLTIIVLLPLRWTQHWKKWGNLFDSIGLATFALDGALSVRDFNGPLGLMILAAMFTGLGGGMIRDLLAGRKPLALKEEIHAVLAIFCGIYVWLDWTNPLQLSLAVFAVVTIRMAAVRFNLNFGLPGTIKKNNF
ncbi:trimeric intracellular cation channel family protein [Salicibibacter halophilus]|uniref:Trimeric intracellular cation channel family protein n=1 Tax=Salicibibacter halophilus TaxID=2502791 RepID=A0A514LFE4_9BACI|nr:trimeric intracellular cation channel family protein [Salicibibacter halophilus]